jgi:erythromycin esterase
MSKTSVADWIRQHATALATAEPTAPFDDLAPLRRVVGDAAIVGLGESTHGAHEQFTVKQRIVRMLVEELGFRSFALEEDETKGIQLDEYVVTGAGDLQDLLADAGTPWRTAEIQQLITWFRSYNEAHPDSTVRVVGVDVVAVRSLAYEAVTGYVAQAAPERAAELEQHFATIRPPDDIQQHITWLHRQPDKDALVEHARRACDLVRTLPATDGQALALHHAEAIMAFYAYHAEQLVALRDEQMARNLTWWRERTGHKVIYWAANVHTANGPQLTISYPPFPPAHGRSAGAYLRQRYGDSYVSIGMTFHHGTVNAGWAPPQPYQVPAPPTHFAESTLGEPEPAGFILDLHTPAPESVRAWLDAPATVRVIGPSYEPAKDADHQMSGGSLADWFDAVVHLTTVTPTRLLPPVSGPDRGTGSA